MAVTSIRAVTSRVDRVLKYAANPEKTTEKASEEIALLHRIDNEVQYAANELKTEHRAYVWTVEGNTNGDMCCEKCYQVGSVVILGYGIV